MVATLVPWDRLDPHDHEQIVSIMLLRKFFPNATRIRPAGRRGDGGVDVLVRLPGSDLHDVYQLKYHTELDASAEAQARESLTRIRDNTDVRVRNWYLAMPVKETPTSRDWLARIKTDLDVRFACEWFPIDSHEALATEFPSVPDFYLHGGNGKVQETIKALTELMKLNDADLSPGAVANKLLPITRQLNESDPHFTFTLFADDPTRKPPRPDEPPSASFPDLLVARRVWVDGNHFTGVDIYARYAQWAEDRDLPIRFNVHAEGDEADDIKRTLQYGTPVTALATELTAVLPKDLGLANADGVVRIAPHSAHRHPEQLRLQVRDPSGAIVADEAFDVLASSTGLTEPGTRLIGRHTGKAFDVEILCDPPAQDEQMRIHIDARRLTGLPVAGAAPGVALLAALRSPNTLHLAARHGPAFDTAWPLPEECSAGPCTTCREDIRALSDIQHHVRTTITVPDLHTIQANERSVLRAAAHALNGQPAPVPWIRSVVPLPRADALSLVGEIEPADLARDPVWLSIDLEDISPIPGNDTPVPGLRLTINTGRLLAWNQIGDRVELSIEADPTRTSARLTYETS